MNPHTPLPASSPTLAVSPAPRAVFGEMVIWTVLSACSLYPVLFMLLAQFLQGHPLSMDSAVREGRILLFAGTFATVTYGNAFGKLRELQAFWILVLCGLVTVLVAFFAFISYSIITNPTLSIAQANLSQVSWWSLAGSVLSSCVVKLRSLR